jgi:predicted NBD/HSP70 family sugar kinase
VLIDINENYRYIYGINMDADKVTIVLSDLKGKKIAEWSEPTETSLKPEELLKKLADKCVDLRTECKIPIEKIAGAGVGIKGIVDKETGDSVHAYGIWEDRVHVGKILEEYLDMPVVVENNVNAFAKAEVLFGAGRDSDNLMLVKWGPGIGSSIIIDGEIYEGKDGKSGELGHYIVDKDGAQCSCGRKGCLETLVSKTALGSKIPELLDDNNRFVAKYLPEQEKKDLDEALDYFAKAIVNATTILAPEQMILYGDLFRIPALREEVLDKCSEYEGDFDSAKIAVSSLIEKEDYIGPVAVFAEEKIYC